jgi:Flp pilus assembly protein TadG
MRRRTPYKLRNARGAPCAAASLVRDAIARLRGDRRGAVALIPAIAATSLMGVAGLTVEVGGWYLLKRNMQAAADAAAMAAGRNLDETGSTAGVDAHAKSVTARNGFVHGQNSTTVTVAPDPATGRVSVTVERPSTAILLRAAGFGGSTRTVRALAVAQVVDAGAAPCVTALEGSLSVGNNTDISASGCALVSNSSSADAFKVGSGGSVANGSGRITAANIVTHGGCEGCVEAMGSKLTLTRSPVPTNYAPKLTNPYANLASWSPPASAVSNQLCNSMPSTATVAPGCYASMKVKSTAPVDLRPGVYYVRGGDLDVQGTLTCTTCTDAAGVSIVLVGVGNAAPGKVDINAQARIDLNASAQPTQPDLDGVLIYRHAPYATAAQTGKGEIDINGGANVRLDGAIVAPTSWVTMGGNGATDPKSCNVFVVHSMEFRGNANLSAAGCDFYGTNTAVPRMARLVE